MEQTVAQKTQHLVSLAQNGDALAVDQLCRVYFARVHWLVRLRMGRELRSKLESMDLVQDALFAAVKDLGQFTYRNEGDFLRWLSRIVENRLRGQIQRLHADKRDIRREVRLKQPGLNTNESAAVAWKAVDHTTPSVILSKQEDLARLDQAISVLNPEYRELILLTKIEGLSYRDIAERTGKSSEAVRKQVARALEALVDVYETI
jgi:RNA polymerase sigma-70 factor (ECF subfamily)